MYDNKVRCQQQIRALRFACARSGNRRQLTKLMLRRRLAFVKWFLPGLASCSLRSHIAAPFDSRRKAKQFALLSLHCASLVPGAGIEPACRCGHGPQPCVYTNSTIRALFCKLILNLLHSFANSYLRKLYPIQILCPPNLVTNTHSCFEYHSHVRP